MAFCRLKIKINEATKRTEKKSNPIRQRRFTVFLDADLKAPLTITVTLDALLLEEVSSF